MSNLVLGIPVPFVGHIRKRRAIRSYLTKLPRLLAKNYGLSDSYTTKQIKRTIETAGLNSEYSCYALAIFSNRDEFDQFHHDIGEFCNYDGMRSEISQDYLHGGGSFSVSDIFSLASDGGESVSDAHHAGGEAAHGGDGQH